MTVKAFHKPIISIADAWHEGVRCLGYWEQGKSYVFYDDGHYFCITKGFLKRIYKERNGL